MVLAAVRVGGQLARGDPRSSAPDGRAARVAQARATSSGEQDALVAEAAADVGRDHADAAFVEAEALGEAGADDVRHAGSSCMTTICSSRLSHHATTPRPSSGAMHWRAVRNSRTTVARRLGLDRGEFHVDVGVEEDVVAPVLVHQRRAGPACLQHVEDRGQRVKIDLDPARRCPPPRRGCGAMHTATGSPTWRTLSIASTGCVDDLNPGNAVSALMGRTPSRSVAVNTRPRSSGGILIERMRAWATGLRRNATSLMRGSWMSATNWPWPRT